MNTTLLIDALVRQTTVLIASLATATGSRTPLAQVANQVFANLVAELKTQGLGNKVIADMFGMALRTYHHRIARLQESSTIAGTSLWEAVLMYVTGRKTVLRNDVLRHFARDDDALVRSILRDLVDSRLIFQTGRGDLTAYRFATTKDSVTLESRGKADEVHVAANLLLVAIHTHGQVTRRELGALFPMDEDELQRTLCELHADGRIQQQGDGEGARFTVPQVSVPIGDGAGWQSALFDHYQAMVTAMVRKLRHGQTRAKLDDSVGGSTYHFDIWPGHPLENEVMGKLQSLRQQMSGLREEVEQHNAIHDPPPSDTRRVTTYIGQTVQEAATDGESANEVQDNENR